MKLISGPLRSPTSDPHSWEQSSCEGQHKTRRGREEEETKEEENPPPGLFNLHLVVSDQAPGVQPALQSHSLFFPLSSSSLSISLRLAHPHPIIVSHTHTWTHTWTHTNTHMFTCQTWRRWDNCKMNISNLELTICARDKPCKHTSVHQKYTQKGQIHTQVLSHTHTHTHTGGLQHGSHPVIKFCVSHLCYRSRSDSR